jgi:hypothetical protein
MSRKKLTLSVEAGLTRRAKAIAEDRGTSVSRLVEVFFSAREAPEDPGDADRPTPAASKRDEGSAADPVPADPVPADYTPSDWARQWRGAFRTDDEQGPESPAGDEERIVREIERKHA